MVIIEHFKILGIDMLKSSYLDNNSKIFVAIAGNIGCGKTTLTRKLSERLGWRAHFESVEDNPYLSDFYGNMKLFSFPLQVYFLTHRFNSHRAIETSSGSSVQDRSIYEDAHIFARALFETGEMSERDYENYKNLYKTMVDYLNPPSVMIFLRRSVDKLMERIDLRGRDCEKNIPRQYIERLNQYYDDWYNSYNSGRALLIDTDELDFLNNEEHFSELVKRIHESIDQKDLFYSHWQ